MIKLFAILFWVLIKGAFAIIIAKPVLFIYFQIRAAIIAFSDRKEGWHRWGALLGLCIGLLTFYYNVRVHDRESAYSNALQIHNEILDRFAIITGEDRFDNYTSRKLFIRTTVELMVESQTTTLPTAPNILQPSTWFSYSSSPFKDAYKGYVSLDRVKRHLSRANLEGCNFRDEDLSSANLENAKLMNCNLFSADLQNANLENANLAGANLRKANLSNANMRAVVVTAEQIVSFADNIPSYKLYGPAILEGAVRPEGGFEDAGWLICDGRFLCSSDPSKRETTFHLPGIRFFGTPHATLEVGGELCK